tara:strand:- start:300 stop:539 length:240 start_codon:yes stop_codon:yes gene_type:complete
MDIVRSLSERDMTLLSKETAEKILRNRIYFEGRIPDDMNSKCNGFFFIEPADHSSQTHTWLIGFELPQDKDNFVQSMQN